MFLHKFKYSFNQLYTNIGHIAVVQTKFYTLKSYSG